MRSLKLAISVAVALFAVAITAASASALTLPDVSSVSGTYPIHLTYTNHPLASDLETTATEALGGVGFLLLLEITKLTNLGKFDVLFEKVTEPSSGNKCFSETVSGEKDTSGTVLTKGSFLIVPLPKEAEKKIGGLLEPEAFKIVCGELKIKLQGKVLSSITAAGGSITKLKVALHGSRGVPALNTYLNDSGAETTSKLELNSGGGFGEAAVNVEGEPEPGGTTAFEITNR